MIFKRYKIGDLVQYGDGSDGLYLILHVYSTHEDMGHMNVKYLSLGSRATITQCTFHYRYMSLVSRIDDDAI